jgi:hypothetical protein
MRVPPAAFAALSLLALAVAGAATAADSGAGASGKTSIHLYAPRGATIEKTASGSCWTNSLETARDNVFRCTVKNVIYDPCFASTPSAHDVLCPLYTPGSQLLRINLTKKLPANLHMKNPTGFDPWVVKIENGTMCTLVTGATSLLKGKPIRYTCQGGDILLGDPNRSTAAWTILAASGFQATSDHRTGILAAYW